MTAWSNAMSIELNHTIVHARDPHASATFLSEMLGRSAPVRFGPFWDVELDNHVTLAYIRADERRTRRLLERSKWPLPRGHHATLWQRRVRYDDPASCCWGSGSRTRFAIEAANR
jgi:hypothetical protein